MEQIVDNLDRVNILKNEEIACFEFKTQDLEYEIENMTSRKSQIQNDLACATDYIITMEQKVFRSNKITLDLVQ